MHSDLDSGSDWSDDEKLLKKRKLESVKQSKNKNSNILNSTFGDNSDLRNFNSNKAVKKTVGRWSNLEKARLIEGIEMYGYHWKLIEDYVETRNIKQIINYTNKLYNTSFEYPSTFSSRDPSHLDQNQIQK